jgi:pentose-5-phosphate-3-epimerase
MDRAGTQRNVRGAPLIVPSVLAADLAHLADEAGRAAGAPGEGADWLHVEAARNPVAIAKDLRARGARAGLSIKPETSLDELS